MAKKNEFPELTLRGLRAFVEVEETGSISDGAKRIGGSSSGVSQQITALEQAIGARLFDRGSRPMRLTLAGRKLSAHAHKILKTVTDAQADLSDSNLADPPKLTLAIIDDLDMSITPFLVAKLQQRLKNCFFSAYSGHSDHMVELLERREADICVSAIVPDDVDGFRSIPLLREQFILVTAKGLLDRQRDIQAQLMAAPFVQYSEAIPIGRAIIQHLKRLRFNAVPGLALEASRSVIAMTAQSNGWSLTTPLNLLDAERFISQIDVFDIPFPAFSRHIYLIARNAELGDLPDSLANDCRQLFADQVIPRFASIAPDMIDAMEIIAK